MLLLPHTTFEMFGMYIYLNCDDISSVWERMNKRRKDTKYIMAVVADFVYLLLPVNCCSVMFYLCHYYVNR